MAVTLLRAAPEDYLEYHRLQVEAFAPLLEKYRDEKTNPGAETPERVLARFRQPQSHCYFILLEGERVGGLRVQDLGERCRLKQIFLLPASQGKGHAQEAIRLAETLYPRAIRWELDTILEEEKLCYLYEKLGYRKTGRTEPLREGMTLVYYEKQVK